MRNVRNEGYAYVHGLYPFPKVDQYNRKQFFSLVYIYCFSNEFSRRGKQSFSVKRSPLFAKTFRVSKPFYTREDCVP